MTVRNRAPAAPEPARPRRTQEERSSLSDARMVAAAISLIVEVGLPGATLAAIGERAGYSRGLVSHRYRTKSGLMAQVHRATVRDWIRTVERRVGDATGLEALQRVVEALCAFLQKAPDEIRAMYMLRYSSIDPGVEYRDEVVRTHRAQRRDAQRWIEEGQQQGTIRRDMKPVVAAELFCSLLDGITYRSLIAPDVAVKELRGLLATHLPDWLRPPQDAVPAVAAPATAAKRPITPARRKKLP